MHNTCLVAVLVLLFLATSSFAQSKSLAGIDVLDYDVTIEPDIPQKTIKGTVTIKFIVDEVSSGNLGFDCGELTIDRVSEREAPLQFSTQANRLIVAMPSIRSKQRREIQVQYHGTPKRGIRFFPDKSQVYTIYSTSQWMVCVDAPDEKATLTMRLIFPSNLTQLGNGRFVSRRALDRERTQTEWRQDTPIPSYIFGFVGGPFRVMSEKSKGVELRYLATGFTEEQVRKIFRDTPDMLAFFESRAGVKYADPIYTQVLAAGGVEQEMSSFTALNEQYGTRVLANEQDLWLGAHEFAHQWWGNMVTCRDFNHFWLNEGIATFMAAAYLQHRFGEAAYRKEIDEYKASYEKVKAAGKDKSLVFPDWLRPTREDRSLVYDKGAYVMHLLREEMGEKAFWDGLRTFTKKYFGKSVVTSDFETAMQSATSKNLRPFFDKWVYLKTG